MIVTSLPMMTSILRAGMAQPGFQPIARVLVVIDAISPALTRLLAGPLVGMPFPVALHASFFLPYGLLGWLIWRDRRDGVRDWVYPITLALLAALLAALELTMAPVYTTTWWIGFTDWMAR